jgi:hypothetical protein
VLQLLSDLTLQYLPKMLSFMSDMTGSMTAVLSEQEHCLIILTELYQVVGLDLVYDLPMITQALKIDYSAKVISYKYEPPEV